MSVPRSGNVTPDETGTDAGCSDGSSMTFKLADYENRLVVAGGDFDLALEARGCAAVAAPELVREVAEVFLDAGAEILVTHTAGAHATGETCGDVEDIAPIYRRSAEICRAAADEHPSGNRRVFGAVRPPAGLFALDEVDKDALFAAYAAEVRALKEGGVDALLCRSFTEIESLCVAVEAGAAAGLPVIAGMTFDCGPERRETTMGVTVPQACAALVEACVVMVACDGGESPDTLAEVVALARASCDLPVWVTLGCGLPELVEGCAVCRESPEAFAKRLPPLAQHGAAFIEVGPGATANHVRAAVEAAKRAKRS